MKPLEIIDIPGVLTARVTAFVKDGELSLARFAELAEMWLVDSTAYVSRLGIR